MKFFSIPRFLVSPLIGLFLGSCALMKPPVADVVEEPPVEAVKKVEVVEVPEESVPVPTVPSDGLRLPGGLLELPNETELRTPLTPRPGGGGGALVVRPPAEPVPRPRRESAADAPGGN